MYSPLNTPNVAQAVHGVPQDLESLAWDRFRTVVVFGQVSKAVWFPPSEDGKCPGVLAAPGVKEARRAMRKVAKFFQILNPKHQA